MRHGSAPLLGAVKAMKTFHQIKAWLKHQLTACNTAGYGVHSPYLFYIVRYVLTDRNRYYVFSGIERERARLLRAKKAILANDYLTGQQGERRVCDIAEKSLKSPREAQLLMRLAVLQQVKDVVELGTSFGITTAYMASAGSDVRVTTFEGVREVAEEAKKVWKKLQIDNINLIVGNIDDTLSRFNQQKEIGLAFIDANSTEESAVRYFEYLAQLAGEKSVFVLGDIHSSEGMERAWSKVCGNERATAAMDLFSIGLVFFDPHLEKRIYKIRF